MSDALERLFNSNNNEQSEYSLEEQMASAEANTAEENEDFFSDMSDEAKKAFFGSGATEVTLDTPEQPQVIAPMNSPISQFMQQQTVQQPKYSEPVPPQVQYSEPIQPTPMVQPEISQPEISKPVVSTSVEEVVEMTQPKRKAGRPPKKQQPLMKETVEMVEKTPKETNEHINKATNVEVPKVKEEPSGFNAVFIPVMNQLAKDLIDDLRQNNYKIARFNEEQMKILYEYMYTKF